MTLISTIIQDAYREGNINAIGVVPSAVQLEEGLTLLSRLRKSVLGTEAGVPLSPIIVGRNGITRPSGYPWYDSVPDVTDWFVPDNSQLVLNLTTAQTVYLSPEPEDGARFAFIDKSGNLATRNLTVNANGRTLGGSASTVFSTNSLDKEYFYRADEGDWKLIEPLEAADEWPYPEEFDDMFVIGLAMRLNPRYEISINPQSVEQYRRTSRMFKARYSQVREMESEQGLIRTLGVRFRQIGGWVSSSGAFNRGW